MRHPVSQTRRERVERGIYRNPSSGKFEYTYTDSNGAQRWVSVHRGGIKAGRAQRAQVDARLARSERVAPTRETVNVVAAAYLESRGALLRPRTCERYESSLKHHVIPALGCRKIASVTTNDVSALIRELQAKGLKPWTIHSILVALSRVFAYAVREGLVPVNPVGGLERGERPSVGTTRAKRVLSNDEIASLIEATPDRYRTLVVTAIFTGLRVGELLGLTWADVDLDRGFIHVRKQLDRQGNRVDPKTGAAVRDIVLLAALAQVLREHKRVSRHTGDGDFVFATRKGTPEHWRNCVTRGIDKATNTTKMNADPGRPKVTMHTLRHSFASHLIVDLNLDVVRVSRMLGHTRPSITEDIYAHEFEQARHAEDVRAAMEASAFGKLLERAASTEVRCGGALDPLACESDGP